MDKDQQEDADNFEKLIDSEWSHRVSHHSLSTLGTSKFNKQILEEQHQLEAWSHLAQATLARLVIFNKRRGGEASKMLSESYLHRPVWKQVNNPEIMASLSGFERELSRRLDMVEIRGKRDRKVPVILTPEVKNSIDKASCGYSR
ncbi:uncharacterized protein [Montipora foliosa]|uniref:uncharacterized protein n=1 Tax=Montipora foliosa TaxID=591990 RepID=UPI0035F18DF5